MVVADVDLHKMIDQKDIDEALTNDPDVIEGKVELADKAAAYWKSLVPVDTGHDRDSIHVVHHGHVVAVVNDDEVAHIIEYGTDKTPPYAPRARTEVYFNSGGGR